MTGVWFIPRPLFLGRWNRCTSPYATCYTQHKTMDILQGRTKVGIQLWVWETEFILVLLFIDYCIVFIQTTVNLLLPHPVYKTSIRRFWKVGRERDSLAKNFRTQGVTWWWVLWVFFLPHIFQPWERRKWQLEDTNWCRQNTFQTYMLKTSQLKEINQGRSN